MRNKSKISLILTIGILSSISGAALAAGPGSAAPSGNLPDAQFNSVTANTASGNAVFGQSSSPTAWSIYGFSPRQ
jgi:hypothetical protein